MENEPRAFPSKEIDHNRSSEEGRTIYHDQERGMTLHDYFAARAMQGMLANNVLTNQFKNGEEIAKTAFKIADNMIIESFKNSEK